MEDIIDGIILTSGIVVIVAVFGTYAANKIAFDSMTPEEQQQVLEEKHPVKYSYEALNGNIGQARYCEINTTEASAGTALGIGGASYAEGAGYLCSKEYDGSNQFPVKSFWLIEDDKKEEK